MCGKTEQESEEGETLHKLPKMLRKMLKHKVKKISAKRCVAKSWLQGKRSFMQENLPAEFFPRICTLNSGWRVSCSWLCCVSVLSSNLASTHYWLFISIWAVRIWLKGNKLLTAAAAVFHVVTQVNK